MLREPDERQGHGGALRIRCGRNPGANLAAEGSLDELGRHVPGCEVCLSLGADEPGRADRGSTPEDLGGGWAGECPGAMDSDRGDVWSDYSSAGLGRASGQHPAHHGMDQVVDGQPMNLGLVAMKDSNLWAIKEVKNVEKKLYGEVRGFVAIYVDDFLTVGPKAVEEELTKRLNSLWPTSAPEFAEVGSEPMKFLGMEIQREADGGYLLHQKSYARELLNRHEVVTESPYVRVPEEKEVVQPTLKLVKQAQKLTGELLWLSGRTRPDVAAAIQRMSQKATRDPAWVIELGKNVLAYVCRTWDYALHYGPKVVQEEDPDMFRRTPRRNGTVGFGGCIVWCGG